jgi:hypothetical protein
MRGTKHVASSSGMVGSWWVGEACMHATSLGVTRGWAMGGAIVHREVTLGVGESAQ